MVAPLIYSDSSDFRRESRFSNLIQLLKNPLGGDTLVIYFEFDSEGLTPRTQRQLSIVTRLLKLDPNKAITISGHTDAKGGDEGSTDGGAGDQGSARCRTAGRSRGRSARPRAPTFEAGRHTFERSQ